MFSVYKIAADQLMAAAGVELLFHAWAAAVLMDGRRVQALEARAAAEAMA